MSAHDSHAASHTGPAHGKDGHGHGGTGKYWVVFFLLCGLTMMSFLTFFDFWRTHIPVHVSWVFMMGVSCCKAMLVICFFMHMIWEANWKYVLTIPASIMSVFLCLALVGDVGMRTRFYTEERWLYAATPVEEKASGHEDAEHKHAHPTEPEQGSVQDKVNKDR